MASHDGDDYDVPSWEVERILAEKPFVNGKMRYLIKWKGFPDEECTWEPYENFNQKDILVDWEQQKAHGDVLDSCELSRIEEQMNAFALRNVSTEQADSSSEDGNKPLKRPLHKTQRLIPDAPLLTKQKASLVQPDSLIGRGNSTTDFQTQRFDKQRNILPVRDHNAASDSRKSSAKVCSTTKTGATKCVSAAAKNVQKTISGQEPTAVMSQTPNNQTKQGVKVIPTQFFSPDLVGRKRKSIDDKVPKRREPKKGAFTSLRHMNKARKKHNEDLPVLPMETFDLDSEAGDAFLPDMQNSAIATGALTRNKSYLFFDESSDESENKQMPTEEPRPQVPTSIENRAVVPDVAGSIQPAQTTTGRLCYSDKSSIQWTPPTTEITPLTTNVMKTLALDTSSNSATISEDLVDTTKRRSSLHHIASERNDLSHQILSLPAPGDSQNCALSSSVHSKSTPYNDKEQLEKVHTFTRIPQRDAGIGFSDGAFDYLSPEHGQVVYAGPRQWMKGDIVLDIALSSSEAGIKLLHIPFKYARSILLLKEKGVHKLPLKFGPMITRSVYETISKQRWFSYFAFGAVEPFQDSASDLHRLASDLERREYAALWQHPTDDIMLVLYSTKCGSWSDLPAKPVRQGHSRLHLAFRQKLSPTHMSSLDELVKKSEYRNSSMSDKASSSVATATDLEDNECHGQRDRGPSVVPLSDTLRSSKSPRIATTLVPSPLAPHVDKEVLVLPDHMSIATDPRGSGMSVTTPLTKPIEIDKSCQQQPKSIDSQKRESKDEVHLTGFPASSATVLYPSLSPDWPEESSERMSDGEATQDNLFPGLGMTLTELDHSPFAAESNDRALTILLVYSKVALDAVRDIIEWLVKQGLPEKRIRDINDPETWKSIRSLHPGQNSPLVAIFDRRYPLAALDGLSKLVENEFVTCWEIDYGVPLSSPSLAALTYSSWASPIFPAGKIQAFVEQAFIHLPEDTLLLLKALRKSIQKDSRSYRLVVPPKLDKVLEDAAVLTRDPKAHKALVEIQRLVQELKMDITEDGNDTFSSIGKTSVVIPTWQEVYGDMPESCAGLSAVEQRRHDDERDLRMIRWFSAWSLFHLNEYRRFQIFLLTDPPSKPENCGHIRIQMLEGVAKNLRADREKAERANKEGKASGANEPSSRSRSRTRTDSFASSSWT